MWITLGKGHFGSYNNNPELYWYKVNKFLTKVLAGNIAQTQHERIYDHRIQNYGDSNIDNKNMN